MPLLYRTAAQSSPDAATNLEMGKSESSATVSRSSPDSVATWVAAQLVESGYSVTEPSGAHASTLGRSVAAHTTPFGATYDDAFPLDHAPRAGSSGRDDQDPEGDR